MPRSKARGGGAGKRLLSQVPLLPLLWAALLLLSAGLASWIALKSTAAHVFQMGSSARALSFSPVHAGANGEMASRLEMADRPVDAGLLARKALRRDPTSVSALRSLALVNEDRGDEAEAARLIALAYRLSRRDRGTQIWLIRDALRRAEFELAADRFDIAMRTTTRGWSQLIPMLVTATADPRMLPPLRRLLILNPRWKVAFAHGLAAAGPRPDLSVPLTRGLLDPNIAEEREAIVSLIQRLVSTNRFDLAWSVYRDSHRGSTSQAPVGVQNGGFEREGHFAPFDWVLAEDPELGAMRQVRADGAGSALTLAARGGRSGEVARQLVRLAPGNYRLRADWGALPSESALRPRLRLSCAADAQAVLTMQADRGGEGVQRTAKLFSVPPRCAWLWLTVEASGEETQPETSPWIDNLIIDRAS